MIHAAAALHQMWWESPTRSRRLGAAPIRISRSGSAARCFSGRRFRWPDRRISRPEEMSEVSEYLNKNRLKI